MSNPISKTREAAASLSRLQVLLLKQRNPHLVQRLSGSIKGTLEHRIANGTPTKGCPAPGATVSQVRLDLAKVFALGEAVLTRRGKLNHPTKV